MIIDFHTHIFSKAIRENREKYFPTDRAFKLLYDSDKAKMVGAAELIRAMDEARIDKSVVFSFPWKNFEISRRENDYVLSSVQKYPDRLIGFSCFDPGAENADREAERCLSAGMSGVGELAFYESGIVREAVKKMAGVMDVCARRNVPVMIHTNEPIGHEYPGKSPLTLKQIYDFVGAYPENRIVLAHLGGGVFFFNLLKREVRGKLKNVYLDTAAAPFLYEPVIYKIAMELAGSDKILFGTDYPLIPAKRYFTDFEKSGISEEQYERICFKNAADLLNIGTG